MARRSWPANGRRITATDYSNPHHQSVAIVNAFGERHLLELAGLGGVIKIGMGQHRHMGWLAPVQQFRGAAGMIGNVDRAAGLVTGLPSPEPPAGRVPTIFDSLRDIDYAAHAGTTQSDPIWLGRVPRG